MSRKPLTALSAAPASGSALLNVSFAWRAGMVDNSTGTATVDAVTTGQIDEPLLVTAADQSILFDGYLDPYGNQGTLQSPILTMNLRLPGQLFQPDSGLSKNGWRDYDPTLGQYVEADPIGIDGGQNLYAYVDGDPLNRIDPRGLAGVPPIPWLPVISWPTVEGGAAVIANRALGIAGMLLSLSGDTPQHSAADTDKCPDSDNKCQLRYEDEKQRCSRLRQQGKMLRADVPGCIRRAQERLRLCIRNGFPAPDNDGGPYEWDPREDGQRYRRVP